MISATFLTTDSNFNRKKRPENYARRDLNVYRYYV